MNTLHRFSPIAVLSLATSATLAQSAPTPAVTVETPAHYALHHVDPVAGCPAALPPGPGDYALANGEYKKAEAAFRAALSPAGPAANKAHNGLIRALLAQQKVAEADTDAKAWLAADPNNVWAMLASARVLWQQGKIFEAQSTLQSASKLDGCIGQLHLDFARFIRFSGLYATAAKQIDLAHRLDPEDPGIAGRWLRTLPRDVQLESVNEKLQNANGLSEEARKDLEREKKYLSQPPEQPCKLVSPLVSTSIPFRSMRNGPNEPAFDGLEVGINGKQRRLQIDTGASGIIVYRSAASVLHLTPEVRFHSYGIGDSADAESYAAKVDRIKIGSLEFANCYIQVIDDSNQRNRDGEKIDQASDGLIGGDVFASFLYTLDFPGHTLKLDPLPPVPGSTNNDVLLNTGDEDDDTPPHDRAIDPSMKDWTKFLRSGHDIILPVVLNGGPYRLFIVDTGADLNLISPDAAREVGKVTKGSDTDIIGISGRVEKTFTTAPLDLAFAGLRQKTQGLTAMDMTRFTRGTGVTISGFIGTPTLHQLTVQIDYRDNLIHFTFDPKRLTRCVSGMKIDDCY